MYFSCSFCSARSLIHPRIPPGLLSSSLDEKEALDTQVCFACGNDKDECINGDWLLLGASLLCRCHCGVFKAENDANVRLVDANEVEARPRLAEVARLAMALVLPIILKAVLICERENQIYRQSLSTRLRNEREDDE